MSAKVKVPTTVFTGFLGSGKTTIISHLIDHLRQMGQEIVYIKNEIGETDLDAELMRGENFVSQELLNGCICCTLVGPFASAADEIIRKFQPDRIIIESAGTADPSAMALMVSDHPLLRRDGVISIIDVLNFSGYQDLTPIAKRQAEMTDLLVLNKIELVDLEQKRRVVGYIRELNEKSPIVEAPEGKLIPDLAFGINSKELDRLLVEETEHHHDDHLEEDQIQAVTVQLDRKYSHLELTEIINSLPKNIFRVKGMVNIEGKGFQVVNAVFRRLDITELPPKLKNPSAFLIFIGHQAKNSAQFLESLF